MPRRSFKPFAAVMVIAGQVAGCADPPARFTQTSDRFTPCDDAPHCVSSQAATDSPRYVAPLAFTGDAEQAHAVLLAVLGTYDNAKIERVTPRFVHATFHTTLGFVDDATFIVQPAARIIDVKSSSRVGYYDFGVNRKRVKSLRERFDARRHA